MARAAVKRQRSRAVKPVKWRKEKKKKIVPTWLPVLTALLLTGMLALTVNYRAYSELTKERKEFDELNDRVQQATTENLSLQEEIFYLKTDPKTIEREADKYGLARPKEEPPIIKEKPVERQAKKTEPAPTMKKDKVSRAGETDKAEKSANRQTPTRK